jgi:chromosome segregation ATPase
MDEHVRTLSASIDVNLELEAKEKASASPGRSPLERQVISRQLEEKQREIDRLQILIEAMSPIPGYDYEKLRRIMVEKVDEIDIDHRDSKIVSLAKKCRGLTVQVNKLSAENENLHQNIRELNSMCNNLRAEVSLSRAASTNANPAEGDQSKELNAANKTVEELRRKYLQMKEESRNLRNILAKELGEGTTIEQVADGNWRGRAQTIVMLKSKIRRLETQLQQGSKAEAAEKVTNPNDVDAKAERAIEDMEAEKKRAIDAMTEDYRRYVISLCESFYSHVTLFILEYAKIELSWSPSL